MSSFRGRALAAVGLLIGFYVGSIGLCVVLIAVAVATSIDGAPIFYVDALALVTTFSVLPALISFDRRARDSQREGCVVASRQEQPRLWAFVDEVAEASGMTSPDLLLLTAEVNAGVLQSGSFLGLRAGKRVMLLGLPLMSVLDEDPLRAVLAHEFGHYAGGDTQIGAVVYRGRVAVARARHSLRRRYIGLAFQEYADIFDSVTRPIMRQQELEADQLGARTTSAETLAASLCAFSGVEAVWTQYVRSYLIPAWQRGLAVSNPFTPIPSLYAAREPLRQAALTADLQRAPASHDTHPSLSERLAALGQEPSVPAQQKGCLDLLDDRVEIEAALRRNMTPPQARASQLTDITWDELAPALGDALGRSASERLRDALGTMASGASTTTYGSLRHALEVLEAGRADALRARLVTRRSKTDSLLPVLRLALQAELVRQGKATWVVSATGPAPYDVSVVGRSKLDVDQLLLDAVAGKPVIPVLVKRKLDLDHVLQTEVSGDVADLARRISRR